MSLENRDSFDKYGAAGIAATTHMAEAGYTNILGTIEADPDGVSTQLVYWATGSSNAGFRWPLKAAEAKIGVAMRIWMTSLPANTGQRPRIISWNNASNVAMAFLMVETTGRLSFYICDGDGIPTLVATTAAPVITALGWWHIEAMVDAQTDATGTMILKVEGVTKLTETAQDFATGTVFQTEHHTQDDNIGAGPAIGIKDMVWWNGLGSENNDFLGTVRVFNAPPTADVGLGTWALTGGATGAAILSANPPDDAKFMHAEIGDYTQAVFTMPDLPVDVSSVRGVFVYVRAGKVDGGDGFMKNGVLSNTTQGNGEDRPITAQQTYWSDLFELDPHTTASWTPGAVNLATMTINRVAT